MKKLMNLFSICIIAGLLLSSCKSSTSITKRHYNKGYYIAHSKNNPSKVKQANQSVADKTNTIEQYQTGDAPKVVINKMAEPKSITTENEVTVSRDQIEGKAKTPSSLQKAFHFKPISINKSGAEVNKTSGKEISSAHDDDDDDGLSLFGFVILLVLILWALGFFIGGFGGLIHLLLVVALVLLILWLLRII